VFDTYFRVVDSSGCESLYQLTGMYGVHPNFHGSHTD